MIVKITVRTVTALLTLNFFDLTLDTVIITGFLTGNRFNKDFDTIHYAYIGYDTNDKQRLTAGVLQVPFEI